MDGIPVQCEFWVGMQPTLITEMDTYSFGLREFKAINICPSLEIIETKLELSLNRSHAFGATAQTKIIDKQKIFNTRRNTIYYAVDFQPKECNR
jgi:hypothetical protein